MFASAAVGVVVYNQAKCIYGCIEFSGHAFDTEYRAMWQLAYAVYIVSRNCVRIVPEVAADGCAIGSAGDHRCVCSHVHTPTVHADSTVSCTEVIVLIVIDVAFCGDGGLFCVRFRRVTMQFFVVRSPNSTIPTPTSIDEL